MAYIDHIEKSSQSYDIHSKTVANSIASEFSASTAYAAGDLVFYDSKLYKFTSAHSAGAWNSSHVTEASVEDEIADLKADLSDLELVIYGEEEQDEYLYKTVAELFSDGSVLGAVVYPPASTTTMGIVEQDGFNTWYVEFSEAMDIFFDSSLSVGTFIIGKISNVTAITPSGSKDLIFTGTNPTRYRYASGDAFPTESNKFHVDVNDTIIISFGTSISPNNVRIYYGERGGESTGGAVVRYDVVQNKTQAEKARARQNLGINSVSGLSDEAKTALLNCFRHIALWDDANRDTYINVLENALYSDGYPRISALLDSSYTPIINDDVNTLKPHITVKYYEDEESSGQTISTGDYSLVGNLNNQQNDIVVSYGSCTTALTVNVLDIYNIYRWEFPLNTLVHSTLGTYGDANKVNNANNRRSLYVDHGKAVHRVAYSTGTSINDGNAYYIPIPNDATQVKVTINPSSWSIAFSVLQIIEGSSVGWIASSDGWNAGTKTVTFSAGEGLVLGLSYRNGDASLVSSDASSIVIEYS